MPGIDPARRHGPVGRDNEVALLDRFINGAGPNSLTLRGDPGAGKSTLWRVAIDHAVQAGFRVLSASPAELEAELPYSVIVDLLAAHVEVVAPRLRDPRRRALQVALAMAEPGDARPAPQTLDLAVLDALTLLAFDAPLLVAVDDLQWIDASSASALAYALRRLRAHPVRFLATRRTPGWCELTTHQAAVLASTEADTLDLEPLGIGAIADILTSQIGRRPRRAVLARIHEISRGNPLIALELARADPATPDEVAAPVTMIDAVRIRLVKLPHPTQEVMAVAALCSGPTLGVLSQVLRRPVGISDVLPGTRAGLLTLCGDVIGFTHPLFAEAARVWLDDPTDCHVRLAALLVDSGEVARHLIAAGLRNHDAAERVHSEAWRIWARGASLDAASTMRNAAAITPEWETVQIAGRLAQAGEWLRDAGCPAEGVELLEASVRLAPSGPDRAALLVRLATEPRDFDESSALIAEALACAGSDVKIRYEALRFRALLEVMTAPPSTALATARLAAVDAAELAGADCIEAEALVEFIRGMAGEPANLDALRRAARLHLPRQTGTECPESWLGIALIAAGYLEEARTELISFIDRLHAGGRVLAAQQPLSSLMLALLELGRWDEALEIAARSRDQVDEWGFALSAADTSEVAARIHAMRGNEHEARRLAALSGAAFEDANQPYAPFPLWVTALLALGRGDTDVAAPAIEAILAAQLEARGQLSVTTAAGWAIETRASAGRVSQAEALAAGLEAEADRLGHPRSRFEASRARGVLATVRGEPQQAVDALEAAVEQARVLGNPFELARCLHLLGRSQRRLKRRRAARAALQEAAEWFTELGAVPWLELVTADLERVGGHHGDRTQLTPSERQVATLVASGRTNREVAAELFVSVKTVEASLSGIYTKLGIRSRTELAIRYSTREAGAAPAEPTPRLVT